MLNISSTTIISNCSDPNAMGRQMSRFASVLGCPVIPVPVQNDIEASGCLLDKLDAISVSNGKNLIVANVAPRDGQARQWPNGSPFVFFWAGRSLVLSSVGGYTLSLTRDLFLLGRPISLLDVKKVLAKSKGKTAEISEQFRIAESQFRSYEFLPWVAKWLLTGLDIPFTLLDTRSLIPRLQDQIWYIDCFGNAKTTLTSTWTVLTNHMPRTHKTRFGALKSYERLADVPDGQAGIVLGSSGYGRTRFLEIVVQGGSAAERFGLKVGDSIL